MIKKKDINFNWKYSPVFRKEYITNDFTEGSFEIVQIPHTNIELPFNNFDEKIYQFESCYKKDIWIDKLNDNERVYIRFNAVMTYAKIYLNGNFVGDHKGGYTPFRLDLTDHAIADSNNSLTVYVDSREREDIPPFGFVVDFLTYGGIYREVSLEYYNEIHIENVAIKPADVLTKKPKLHIDLYFHNQNKSSKALICKFGLFKDDECKHEFTKKIRLKSKTNQKISIKENLTDVDLWSIDNPNLYSMKIDLIDGKNVIDKNEIRFGFRDIKFKKDGFYLNGEKIKLRGLNRHQSFPYVGYAMPKSAQEKDAEILKDELGVNIVRLSHYPQSDHFLNRCDELGLLVFDEIPGWQHIGDESWQDISIKNTKEMILKDINHPSVIIWGVRINESQNNDEFYKKTNAVARSIDDSRPTGGVRNMGSRSITEDVFTYNDFIHSGKNEGLDKKRNITKTNKAYLVTEHNGHMFPTKKFDNESRRIEHALRHLNVLEAMEKDDEISGAIGWCMFDYNTHKDFGSGDKICYHGVMDMYRIPKYAAFAYKSQQNRFPVMSVCSSFNIGEYNSSFLEDIHIFTNCDYVKLYKNDEYINTFYPDKEKYSNLPNPPVIIDDLVGDTIAKNEKFSEKDAETIKKLLMQVSKTGLDLSIKNKLQMGKIFLKYKLNMADAENLYTKYFGGWGDKATNYYFEGYINDKSVCKVTKGQVSKANLIMSIDKNKLTEDITYDTTRITLNLVDQHGNSITYANDALQIETEGPVKVIGPKTISLIGGSIGFWIKTTGKSGDANIKIISERFGVLNKNITIEKI
ncbi:MAG: glycoside hydrolase family 2 protein [Clostridium sp.]|nr:glycoside hydrolase family 2 protein [Clostridium sp.]